MEICFDKMVDRRGSQSIKWDFPTRIFGAEDVLPMWVADMDFPTCSAVRKVVEERAMHGIYGYTSRTSDFYAAICDWQKKRHNWEISSKWIVSVAGVVPAINMAIAEFTSPGDEIVIQPPVYPPFFSAVNENSRQLILNDLIYTNGRYQMDFADLEEKFRSGSRTLILCNPHNPVGRVWSRTELQQLAALVTRYNVFVIIDEIWSDLVLSGYSHTPLAAISPEIAQNSITCIAPSKTFNLAGLAAAAVIIPNSEIRKRFASFIDRLGLELGNLFGTFSLEAAYTQGEEWLDSLIPYLEGNISFAVDFINSQIPGITTYKPEGTYLLWLDCRSLGLRQEELRQFLITKAKLGLNDGLTFGTSGEGFMRMNIACPRSILEDGLNRLKNAIL